MISFFPCTNMHRTIISNQQVWEEMNKTCDPLCLLKIIVVFLFVWQYVEDVAVGSDPPPLHTPSSEDHIN